MYEDGVLVGLRAFQLRSNAAFQSPKIRVATSKLTSPSTQTSLGRSCLTSHNSGSTQGETVGCI